MSLLPSNSSSSTTTVVAVAAAVAVVGSGALLWNKRRNERKAAAAKANQQRGIVYLHGFPRAKWIPNGSPFVLKLETYLRLARIPYTFVGGMDFSDKGKMPWIEFNGVTVTDTEFIMNFLEQQTESLDAHLSDQQKALSTAFQRMVNESTFWTAAWFRWHKNNKPWITKLFSRLSFPMNYIMPSLFIRNVKKATYYHGYGRHSDEELAQIGCKDWDAVSTFLGDKPFFHGDKPSRIDASLFGLLAQLIYAEYSEPVAEHVRKLPNLVRYCDNMKRTAFPDWDQLLAQGDKGRIYSQFPVSVAASDSR